MTVWRHVPFGRSSTIGEDYVKTPFCMTSQFRVDIDHVCQPYQNEGSLLVCILIQPQKARFMGPTWGPPGSCRPHVGPMNLAIGEVINSNGIGINLQKKSSLSSVYFAPHPYLQVCHLQPCIINDDVMACKHSPHYWPFVSGIHRSPVDSSQHSPLLQGFDIFMLLAKISS